MDTGACLYRTDGLSAGSKCVCHGLLAVRPSVRPSVGRSPPNLPSLAAKRHGATGNVVILTGWLAGH